MNVIGDDHYIYTTHISYNYTLVIVQNSIGEVIELQIEKYYE
tara:strand:+ start:305 stop:430 length:126 start_codon:yes stop_codon:yes gene_type:complete